MGVVIGSGVRGSGNLVGSGVWVVGVGGSVRVTGVVVPGSAEEADDDGVSDLPGISTPSGVIVCVDDEVSIEDLSTVASTVVAAGVWVASEPSTDGTSTSTRGVPSSLKPSPTIGIFESPATTSATVGIFVTVRRTPSCRAIRVF